MGKYLIGMDGGGTKTAVTIADESGAVLETFTSGGMNYNGQDSQQIEKSFAEMFHHIRQFGALEDCLSLCIGTAGISNPTVRQRIEEQVRGRGYSGLLHITGDHEIALCGANGRLYGMILVAGTGSICCGTNEAGKSLRTGGFGYLIDDEGSGYAIGRDILSAVVRAHDGRLPETVLSEKVFKFLSIHSVPELIDFVYRKETGKKEIAALSILLPEACASHDPAALNIVDKCVRELTELVAPVADGLGFQQGQLPLAGSILTKDVYIRACFEQRIHSMYQGMTCIQPKFDAAYGAVLLAKALVTGK